MLERSEVDGLKGSIQVMLNALEEANALWDVDFELSMVVDMVDISDDLVIVMMLIGD